MTALPLITEPVAPDEEAGLGCVATARGNLPLAAVDIDARIIGLLHSTQLRQTFVNAHDEPLEATYIFPLPDRAAVTAFRMEVGDRVIEGILKERAEARRDYDEAIETGQRAAIAEEERPNVFTVRVGNLMPGDTATVQLLLTGPLTLDSGEATWRFPLVVAPRYIPGTPLDGGSVGDGVSPDTDTVPDASRITPPVLLPGFPNPVRFSMRVDVDPAGLPVADLRSSLPADIDGAAVTVTPGQRLDRDAILRFGVGAAAIHTSLITHEGTFALTLVPPALKPGAARPRDVAFVLDRSGSMEGWKMVAARRAVARMIDTLGAQDRFALLAFDDVVEHPPTLAEGLVAATDRQRFRAVEYLATTDARGGTEMLASLLQAVEFLAGRDSERERVLVLATDGQVGNEDQILEAVAKKAKGVRIFTVGIDTAVNDAFLRRLAAVGAGSCELVESEDRLDEVMERIHNRIGTPVLTNLKIKADGLDLDVDSIAPSRLPSLHAGAPVVILGRYRGRAGGAVKVKAKDAAGNPWSATVPVADGGADALASAWARAHIRDLEDRYVTNGGDDELEREIVATSLEGHVLSRFTAFVAVDVRVVNEGGQLRRVTQPVDAPHGWDMFADKAAAMPAAPVHTFLVGGAAPAASAPPPPMAPTVRTSSPKRKLMVSKQMVREEAAEKPVMAPLDLSPYRERAAQLADLYDRSLIDAADFRMHLAALIDDLRSVGAPADEIDPLARLLKEIDGGRWSGEVTALKDFGQGLPTKGRRAFWRR